MYGAAFPVAKVRMEFMSQLVILSLWKVETMIIRNRTFQAGNTKETPQKGNAKPIFVIPEELGRDREIRGIFYAVENQFSLYLCLAEHF